MLKLAPATEQFQHFVSNLRESFWGDLNGRTREAWKKFFEADSERQRDRFAVVDAYERNTEQRRDYRNGYYERDFVTVLGTLRASASYSGYLLQQTYDGDRLRVKKLENGTATYYLRSSVLGGHIVAELDAAGAFTRGFVYVGGQLLAVQQSNQVSWVHQDPVVKSKRVTNAAGTVISTVELDPWGGATNRSSNEGFQPRRFTTYDRDGNASDEAMHRRYNRWHSRFDQPDPYGGSYDMTNPQSFNRYSYVRNDPVNFVDPLGLDGVLGGALAGTLPIGPGTVTVTVPIGDSDEVEIETGPSEPGPSVGGEPIPGGPNPGPEPESPPQDPERGGPTRAHTEKVARQELVDCINRERGHADQKERDEAIRPVKDVGLFQNPTMEIGGAATGAATGRVLGLTARATLGATGIGLAVGLVGDVVFGIGYNLVREELRQRRVNAEGARAIGECYKRIEAKYGIAFMPTPSGPGRAAWKK